MLSFRVFFRSHRRTTHHNLPQFRPFSFCSHSATTKSPKPGSAIPFSFTIHQSLVASQEFFPYSFQPLTNCLKFATLSQPFSFQPIATVKFLNSFCFITNQQCRGVPLARFTLWRSFVTFCTKSVSQLSRNQQFPHSLCKTPGWVPPCPPNPAISLFTQRMLSSPSQGAREFFCAQITEKAICQSTR